LEQYFVALFSNDKLCFATCFYGINIALLPVTNYSRTYHIVTAIKPLNQS